MTVTEHTITCPGCGQPLHVPLEAVGKPAHCPHCRTNFFLPANPDGSPGSPQLPRGRIQVPLLLAGPALALLVVGLVGVVVNGMMTVLFAVKPGSELDYARGRVQEIHNIDAMLALKESGGKAAKAEGVVAEPNREADEELARVWAPAMKPIHLTFLIVSVVTVFGGAAMLSRRFYPLAFIGCLAAMANVNNFCCVPGGIAGLWGILVLVRDDGRELFRRRAKPSAEPPIRE